MNRTTCPEAFVIHLFIITEVVGEADAAVTEEHIAQGSRAVFVCRLALSRV